MDNNTKQIIWNQFGAAIDTMENAINACPDQLWSDDSKYHQYWYMVYHTLFFLDYYLDDDRDNFQPPDPYTLSELDPAGVMPDRVYTKEEMLKYLEYGRNKCKETIMNLSDKRAKGIIKFRKADIPFDELLLYKLRHVQHHAAQLNLILRQETNSAPGWVFRAG